jgi:hypothetical protein
MTTDIEETMDFEKHCCRICGLYHIDLPWGEDGITPTFNICPCCGVEFGYEDDTDREGAINIRKAWLAHGAKWLNEKRRPPDWNLEQQLRQIPTAFRE